MFMLTFGSMIAQRNNPIVPDQRLYEVFEEEFIQMIERENQNLLLYYNLYLTNSFEIIELPEGKSESLKLYKKLNIPDGASIKEINVLKFKLDLLEDKPSYYRMGDGKKILRFKSAKAFNEEYNAERLKHQLIIE